MPNTVAADVTAFLKKNSPKAYCDDGLAAAVNAKRRQQATGPLEAAGHKRTVRRCDGCGSTTKKAISL